jgi:pyruvate formate lyase activating enzyme
METCGHTQWFVLEHLLPYLDHVLFDLKHVDDELHRIYTGAGNDLILSNLRRLAALKAPLTIRVPLIPGFNASAESVGAIAEFVSGLDGTVQGVDLLPYHTLGKAKYKALGREYPWEENGRLADAEVEALARVVESYGLTANVGG